MKHAHKMIMVAAVFPLAIALFFVVRFPASLIFSTATYYVGPSDADAVSLLCSFAFLLVAPGINYFAGSKKDKTEWSWRGLGLAYLANWCMLPAIAAMLALLGDWLGFW